MDRLSFYRRTAIRRLRSCTEAEEVVQSFALKAIARKGQLRDPGAVHAWLRRIFETSLIDHCRRAAGRKARELPFEEQLHDRAEHLGAAPESPANAVDMVARLLPSLKPEYGAVIRRVYLQELSLTEVAADLGITVNNLAVRVHRARAALRRQLDLSSLTAAADRVATHAAEFVSGRAPRSRAGRPQSANRSGREPQSSRSRASPEHG